jgi:tetratricopeptide (TPR) repeat protein
MRRVVVFSVVFLVLSLTASAQKSRVISANNLLDSEKYEEAKTAIDLAVQNDKTYDWHRTYLVKGLLCQKAFQSGFDKAEKKKTDLYPNQLFVAYDSYEKALELDSGRRTRALVETQYYLLVNDFQKLGKRHYQKREFALAMKAFEHALLVAKSPLISVKVDTGLIYNTAIAAYESRNWDKAILYLTGLDEDAYSTEVTLLLQKAFLSVNDSLAGEIVLREGVEKYDYDRTIVLQLVDLYVDAGKWEEAITLMDSSVIHKPENPYYPWTRALLYQNREMYEPAIADLIRASELAPAEEEILYNLGICYYNMGVELNESALRIRNNTEYRVVRAEALANFNKAVSWFEKAHQASPSDQATIRKLYQLYSRLEMTEKRREMQRLLR